MSIGELIAGATIALSLGFAGSSKPSPISLGSLPTSTVPKGSKPAPHIVPPSRPIFSFTEEKPVSINASNMEPAQVLQILSRQSGMNMILLAATDKKLTLNLQDVRLEEMIRHICALTGLASVRVGNTYVFGPEAQLKGAYAKEWEAMHPSPPPVEVVAKPEAKIVTEVLLLNYVTGGQVATVLQKIYPPETSGLAVVAAPLQTSPQLDNDNGTASGVGTGGAGLAAATTQKDTTGKMVILRGAEDVVLEALSLVRQMDTQRAQVMIEVTIHDISDAALRDLGLNWTYSNVTISEGQPTNNGFGTFARTPLSFTAAIKALEKADKAKLLANPSISVMDGERGSMLSGDRITYPVVVGFSNAGTPIFSKEEVRVGIYLQVAASISGDGFVTLGLYPQVSTITGFQEINGGSYPQMATREAQSTIRVKTGETIVMGGMLKTEETSLVEAVPILSRIPILGELFKRRRNTKSSSQVIISIRPVVIRSNES